MLLHASSKKMTTAVMVVKTYLVVKILPKLNLTCPGFFEHKNMFSCETKGNDVQGDLTCVLAN